MKKTWFFMLWVFGHGSTSIPLCRADAVPVPPPLTGTESNRFISLAREYAVRLWTNDYYMSTARFSRSKSTWLPLQPFRKDLYTDAEMNAWPDNNEMFNRMGIKEILVIAKVCSLPRDSLVEFHFSNRESNTIASLYNPLYVYTNVPYRQRPDGKFEPFHVYQSEAIKKAIGYARMFGVTNLTDTAKFRQTSAELVFGEWRIQWNFFPNGYNTWRGVTVCVADLPGGPLGKYSNTLTHLPPKLPSRIVLTPEQAKGKAREYMKEYFPFKDVATRMISGTNWVQYILPDYNYIRHDPQYGPGISGFITKGDDWHLAYFTEFGSTDKDDNPSGAVIYLDAETGEMLGGWDSGK